MSIPDLARSEARRRLLGLFFARAGNEFHLRELQRRIAMSLGATQHVVGGLAREGLLRRRRLGNLALYSLNPAHPLYREVESVVTKTTGIAPLLGRALNQIPEVKLALIYGSYVSVFANSNPAWTGESDVDLMVVGDADPRQVSRIAREVGQKTSRRINYTIFEPDELLHRIAKHDSFVDDVLARPLLPLAGFPGSDSSRPVRLKRPQLVRLLKGLA